jgi:acetoin utilization deacetylase AcuC-like enzyme
MIVITTEHAAHDPDRFTLPSDTRPYWEVPARADALLGALRAGGLVMRPAADHGLAPIERVHDAGYLSFLQTAFVRWQALPGSGPILRAPAYAVRHTASTRNGATLPPTSRWVRRASRRSAARAPHWICQPC